jgi:CBS domain containing-hemolysin-like protein
VLLATVFSMIVGELVPKNFALAVPLATAKIVVPFQIAFTTVLKPLILLFNNTANAVIRSLGVEPKEELSGARTAEELSSLVRRSATAGVLDDDHATLLGRTLRFSQRSAADVLTPRVRMVSVDIDATAGDVIAAAGGSGYSRFPVIGKDSDDVRGVVHVKQAFAVPLRDQATVSVGDLMTDALRVPQSMGVDSLLGVLRNQSYQIAIVLDEFGGTEGVVTLEDLVEELVGELEDEHDRPRHEVRRTGLSVVFDAALRPDEVLDRAGVRVPEDGDYDTVGGFVTDQLDRVAELGDEVPTSDGVLRVERVNGGRVERLRFVPATADADLAPVGAHDHIVQQLREDLS